MTTHPPAGGTRRIARAGLFALSLVVLGGTGKARAQHPAAGHRVTIGGERLAGVTTVSPASGPAGSAVTVRSAALPPGTPVQVMIGALRSGFEVVAITVTDEEGNLAISDSVTLTVPDWVESDRTYLFIVTDREYNPLAAADVFHVTDANGMVTRAGRIMHEPTACPTLTNDADELYFLAGNAAGLAPGEEVEVAGPIVESEACGRGVTIDVREIRRRPGR